MAVLPILAESASNLREAIKSTRVQQLDPLSARQQLQREFAQNYALALATTGEQKALYADKLAAALPTLSEALKATSSTSVWMTTMAKLFAQSNTIADQLDATAPKNYQEESLGLLDTIDASLAVLDDSTRAITRAIEASGGVTAAGLRDVVLALGGTPTSWGRSAFKDLTRVESEATTVGALTSLSANYGTVLTGGTSGKVYMPALLLRDELRRKAEARKALGKVPVFFDSTATASQTAFVAPKGYTIKALYHNGTLKREATTGVYWTRSNDGFAETATLSVGASASDWISLMCVRA